VILGSGVDVIEIARLERALAERGEHFEQRVFTPQEIAACRCSRRPSLHFALRFAAKEAAMKAVGTGWGGGVRWVDVETVSSEGRPPSRTLGLSLHGRAGELAAGARLHLAVTHSRSHALAVVVLERPS
jgi:holo-[acyl-carrier protein] synthase